MAYANGAINEWRKNNKTQTEVDNILKDYEFDIQIMDPIGFENGTDMVPYNEKLKQNSEYYSVLMGIWSDRNWYALKKFMKYCYMYNHIIK